MRMCIFGALLFIAVGSCASGPGPDETISDWQGMSATLSQGDVDSNGVAIHYHTVGEGPLVVLVHGLGSDWWDYRNQIPTLATRYQVVAMSTRGTGRSDKPEGVEQYSVARTADDIDALIRHFNKDGAVIVGQDAGGFHAWNFAMTYPEKTKALIAMGSYHPAGLIRGLAENPDQQKAAANQQRLQVDPEAAVQYAERPPPSEPRPGEPPEIFRMRVESSELTDRYALINFFKANWPLAPFSLETMGFGHTLDDFPPVQSPTLVIHGEEDGILLVGGLRDLWTRIDSDLTLHVLPDVGHGPHTQVPEFVTPRIMEWLDNQNISD